MLKRSFAEKQRSRFYRKYPAMSGVTITRASLAEAPLDEAGAMIARQWRRVYGDRLSLCFSGAMFRHHLDGSGSDGLMTIARHNGEIHGCAVALPVEVLHRGERLKSCISTAMCTSGDFEGKGMTEILMAEHVLAMMDAGYPISFHWRAMKDETQGKNAAPGRKLYRAEKSALYARPLIPAEAARLGKLNLPARLGVHALGLLFRPGRSLPPGCTTHDYDKSRADEVSAFITENQPETACRRYYSPAALNHRFHFSEAGIHGFAQLLHHDGALKGIIFGCTNPVNETAAWFEVDGAVFHPDIPGKVKRRFFSCFEATVRDRFGSFAMLVPGASCRENLTLSGYVPVKHYFFGATELNQATGIQPCDISRMCVELR